MSEPTQPHNTQAEELQKRINALPKDKQPTAENLLRALEKFHAAYPEGLTLEEDGRDD